MTLIEYMQTYKYEGYYRNEQIFKEDSTGVFYKDVISRIKLELMGAGAIVQGDNVLTGFSESKASYSPICSLVVPSSLLSATTSAYISYSTAGDILFNGEEDPYLVKKIKEIIKIQSIGGSVLVKKVEGVETYLNLYTPLSYFTVMDEFIQDVVESYNIFNKIMDNEGSVVYLIESHIEGMIMYRYLKVDKESQEQQYMDTVIEGMSTAIGEDLLMYSFELINDPIVYEVENICFGGESDYTKDNIARLKELVVTDTINSQTFDKISNPLLALPEEALEYDLNGNAKINLQDRVIIIREGGNKPEQIKLESKIEQAQIHKGNIENGIFSSLAINKTALGLTDVSQLSGEALRRMMSATIARVEEKRTEVAGAIYYLLDKKVSYSEVIEPSFDEKVTGVEKAVNAGVMSQEMGTSLVSSVEDWEKIKKEREADGYRGFEEE